MQRTTAFLLATFLTAGSAAAADYPIAKPTAPASVFNWSGLYLGGNAGYGWGRYKEEYFVGGASVGSESIGLSGGLLGAQVGANVQTGNIVWGIEADIQKSWISGSESYALPGLAISVDLDVDWFATVRGRLGFADGPSLYYLTAGYAHGSGKATATVNGVSGSVSDSMGGWTAGVGYEAALGNNWSWKMEYLYADFGGDTANLGGGVTAENSVQTHIVRFGANYRFGY